MAREYKQSFKSRVGCSWSRTPAPGASHSTSQDSRVKLSVSISSAALPANALRGVLEDALLPAAEAPHAVSGQAEQTDAYHHNHIIIMATTMSNDGGQTEDDASSLRRLSALSLRCRPTPDVLSYGEISMSA